MSAGKEFVQKAVSATFGQGSTFTAAKDASGGFLSSVQFLAITKPNGEKLNVVMKLPDIAKITEHYDKMNAADRPIGMEFINAAHDNEAFFLTILGQYKRETGELPWLAEVYGAENTKNPIGGYMFMQDLSEDAVLPDDIKPQPESVMKGAIDAVADLAIVSFSKPELLKDVKPFTEIYNIVMPDVKNGLGYLHKNYPDIFPTDADKIMNSFDFKHYLNEFVRGKKSCPILVHRDVFPRNMLVDKKDPTKFVTHLDWQLGGVGRPGEDLSRLLTTSLDPEERRAKTEFYLRYYLEAVKEKCDKKGLDLPFTYEDVSSGFEGSFQYSTLLFCNVSSYCLQAIRGKVPEEDCQRLVKRCYGCAKDAFSL